MRLPVASSYNPHGMHSERGAPAGAGRLLGQGCALLLLIAGSLLLLLTFYLVLRAPADDDIATLAGLTSEPTSVAEPERAPEDRRRDARLLSPSVIADLTVPQSIDQTVLPARAFADADRLLDVPAPPLDYYAAAADFGMPAGGPRVIQSGQYAPGDRLSFMTAEGVREAELVHIGGLAYYWVESGLILDRQALIEAAAAVETEYYPLLSRWFGQEWLPGVDSDARFHILHVSGAPEAYELGYFSDEDEYPASLFEESNEKEIVYLSMTHLEPGTELYYGTLIHELQHLVQWNLDPNESKWLNEGLSQLAETIAGLDTVDVEPYREHPHLRLDQWHDSPPEVYGHYAASYLFLAYFMEQAGDAALFELVRHPANGLAAVNAVLAGYHPDMSLGALVADWATANFLDGRSGQAAYNYERLEMRPPFFKTRVRRLPFESVETIQQFGPDYIDLDYTGLVTVTFAGDAAVDLVDEPPLTDTGLGSEAVIWFAPMANSTRATLTAELDLTGLTAATLEFDAWYDLEAGFDFAYVTVSNDGGATWRILSPVHATTGVYGPALGGRSRDQVDADSAWVHEAIPLDHYAGGPLVIRFEVLTDFEELGRGFALANLGVPELRSPQSAVWQPDGFVGTNRQLPQQWNVRLIREGREPEVLPFALDSQNRGQATVDLGADGGVLQVVALTPFVQDEASYWIRIEAAE